MNVVLTNAYSRANVGDGLLVDLSCSLIRAAGYDENILRVSFDPASFDDSPTNGAPAAIGLARGQRIREALTASVAPGQLTRLRHLVGEARTTVAVGGGYLRFGYPSEAFKATAVHLSQIDLARRSSDAVVLLPQSIGPLRVGRRRVLRTLADVDRIYARDDRT